MKKQLCAAALLMLLSLAGCSPREKVPAVKIPETTIPKETAVPTQTQTEPASVSVSPLAVEEFLDFGTSSGERQESVEFVMVHFTSAVVGNWEDPYGLEQNREIFETYEIGIHYLIDREGVIHSYLPEDRAAWHAGRGTWKGDPRYTDRMNQYSIGIELLGIGTKEEMARYLTSEEYERLPDGVVGFTENQYESLKKLLVDICARNGIPMDREHIIGHSEYSPGKSDPGQLFSWKKVLP